MVVETDGYRYHRGAAAFQADRERDNRLMALGYDVIRLTYWTMVNEPERVVALVRGRLRRGRQLHGLGAHAPG